MDWQIELAKIILQISDPKVARMACEILIAIARLYLADHPDDSLVTEIVSTLRNEVKNLDAQIDKHDSLTPNSQSS